MQACATLEIPKRTSAPSMAIPACFSRPPSLALLTTKMLRTNVVMASCMAAESSSPQTCETYQREFNLLYICYEQKSGWHYVVSLVVLIHILVYNLCPNSTGRMCCVLLIFGCEYVGCCSSFSCAGI